MKCTNVRKCDDSFSKISTSAIDSWLSRMEQVGVLSDCRLLHSAGYLAVKIRSRRGQHDANGVESEEEEDRQRQTHRPSYSIFFFFLSLSLSPSLSPSPTATSMAKRLRRVALCHVSNLCAPTKLSAGDATAPRGRREN